MGPQVARRSPGNIVRVLYRCPRLFTKAITSIIGVQGTARDSPPLTPVVLHSIKDIKMPFPVDEKFVVKTEDKLGVRFPASFRNKMMENNGGEVQTPPDAWNLYPFFDTSDKKRIKRTSNDIVRETNKAREWPNFPEGAIAIGSNGSGDQLIFIKKTNNHLELNKSVFWWDHETGNINKIADDFKEIK
jgi:hypothetical protein